MNLSHPTHVEIDIDRLHENLDLISRVAGAPLLPVVKADAYGHGAVPVAREIAGRKDIVEGLCVGTVNEALELRRAGMRGRIVVLDGVFPEQAGEALRHGLEAVVSSVEEARTLASSAGRKAAEVHVKINTGMTRLGAEAESAMDVYKKIAGMRKIRIAGLMTHLADAGRKRGLAPRQLKIFDEISSAISAAGHPLPPRHAANTAAVFRHPASRLDLVRPGLGVYGVQAFPGPDAGLKPVLSWRARIAIVRKLKKGQTVSYGMLWTSPGRREAAVVCAGYADGYSTRLSNRAKALFRRKPVRQVGMVCMDSCLFDVTGTGARAGDTVTLIGEDGKERVTANDLARLGGVIPYEILCGIGRRAKRVYMRSGEIVTL
ncbi:MAG: alanine racemase [Candidatus Nitrospinota bacterium M3_3B_026]